MMQRGGRFLSFTEELKRRRVFRVAGAHIAIGLAVIYAADVIFPRVGLPEWSVTLVIVLTGVSLLVSIGLAWAFDVTPEGVVRTDAAKPDNTGLLDIGTLRP